MKKMFSIILLLYSLSSFSQKDTINLDEVQIKSSYSAVNRTPFTFLNIDRKEIVLQSAGMDPSTLLSKTPSVNFYSDNGTGLGYTYFRLRGIDQTRINSTLNGVPLNEPEDQGIYYNNYTGFLNSISDIQIIRGVGLSKPGVSSYGGSINFNSLKFSEKFSGYGSALYGSFGTRQINGGINSPNLFLNANYSSTDGYKYNSFNNSQSVFYGSKLNSGKNTFCLYGFIGYQKNGMAWIGEPMDSILKDLKYNSNTKDETDDFLQVHNQLSWSKNNLKIVFYNTYLNGWYDTDMAHYDTSHPYGDLVNRIAVKSNWLGTCVNYNKIYSVSSTNIGLNSYTYNREHAGSYSKYNENEPWYYPYNNTGTRNEVSPYIKEEIRLKTFSFYGDIQYRYTDFSYAGLMPMEVQRWNFLNWSGGVSVKVSGKSHIYYGIGKTHREPTRSDLFSGWDDLDTAYFNPIDPESVLSNELGLKYSDDRIKTALSFYYMNFTNEIVLNGEYGPNGILLHQNAASSFRSGAEINIAYDISSQWKISTASSYSYNKISQDGQVLNPVLSPNILSHIDIVYKPFKSSYLGLSSKFNGKSYIDFSNEHTLPSYVLLGVYGGVKYKKIETRLGINNITNELVLSNAVIGYDGEPLYFISAGINGNISVTINF